MSASKINFRSKKKFYVVWVGRSTGVFSTWSECEKQVKGFPCARYKSFQSESQAREAYISDAMFRPSQKASVKNSKPQNKPKLKSNTISIYTDGACSGNPGPSGGGVAIYYNKSLFGTYYGGYRHHGTNNGAELEAIRYALSIHRDLGQHENLAIFTDSKYCIEALTRFRHRWRDNGWKLANGGTIQNKELIIECNDYLESMKPCVDFHYVKGHSGVVGNHMADRLAVYARKNGQESWVCATELCL